MDTAFYLERIQGDAGALLAAAQEGLAAPVPRCPGWTVGHVVAHVGRGCRWMAEIVTTRSQAPVPIRPNDHSFDPRAPGLLDWFQQSVEGFVTAMSRVDPDESVWTWSGDNGAGFWLRLQAHETAIHRTDAESAHGEPHPIDAVLARDGIDAVLAWFLPRSRAFSLLPGRGESYAFRQTDGDGRWLVRFAGNEVIVTSEVVEADVTAEGPASDLLLFLWHRLPSGRLAASGDRGALERFHELANLP